MSEIKSLARGLQILELLGEAEDSVGVTELAKEIGVDKSSISRLVQTLVNHGFAERDLHSRRYHMGAKIRELSKRGDPHSSLRGKALPFLQKLVENTSENAHVAIYSMGQSLVIADVESTAQLRVVSEEGRLEPLYCTAIGKCILAFSDVPFPSNLPSLTPRTITSHSQLRHHLDQIQNQGYALDDEENIIGVRCLAAPVFDHSGNAIATIGISGPTIRLPLGNIPSLAKIVMETAVSLSQSLGHKP